MKISSMPVERHAGLVRENPIKCYSSKQANQSKDIQKYRKRRKNIYNDTVQCKHAAKQVEIGYETLLSHNER
jgi:hypothetical protein